MDEKPVRVLFELMTIVLWSVTRRMVGAISTGVVTWLATTATDTTISREAVMDYTDKWWPDHDQQHCRCCRGRVRNIPLTYWLLPTGRSVVVAPQILLKSFFCSKFSQKICLFPPKLSQTAPIMLLLTVCNPDSLTSIADEYFLSSLVAVSSLLATHLPNFMIYLQTGTLSTQRRRVQTAASGESRATSGVWESVFQLST